MSFGLSNAALAGSNPSGTGQPNQDCEALGTHPGNAASARGSAFNPNGTAGAVYANPDSKAGNATLGTPGHDKVVSQYDVACYQQSLRIQQQTARNLQQSTGTLAGHGMGAQMATAHGGGRGR